MENNKDMHKTHAMATLAIMQAVQTVMDRLAPENQQKLRDSLAGGTGRVALFVTNDGANVRVELALIPVDVRTPFEEALLCVDGPVLSPAAAPDSVNVTDRGKLN